MLELLYQVHFYLFELHILPDSSGSEIFKGGHCYGLDPSPEGGGGTAFVHITGMIAGH